MRGHNAKKEETIEISIDQIELLLRGDYHVAKRSIALLLLQEDEEIISLVKSKERENFEKILQIVHSAKEHYQKPLSYIINVRRQAEVSAIVDRVMDGPSREGISFREKLSRVMIHPLSGLPILLLILYYGLYKFVGEFGAGTVVDFIETDIFENILNPKITQWIVAIIPWHLLQELFVGKYGMITLGVRYAVALILPIVTTFFIVFAIIEDTGYLPRLALLIDRLFKKIGFNRPGGDSYGAGFGL